LFNLNFNHSFNQIYINIKQTLTKSTFYKTIFSDHNHKNYHNTKPQKLSQYQTTARVRLAKRNGFFFHELEIASKVAHTMMDLCTVSFTHDDNYTPKC
jgi:hypothetical protein